MLGQVGVAGLTPTSTDWKEVGKVTLVVGGLIAKSIVLGPEAGVAGGEAVWGGGAAEGAVVLVSAETGELLSNGGSAEAGAALSSRVPHALTGERVAATDLLGRGATEAGAGGSWNVINETPGGSVAQSTPVSCGAARGEMLSGISEADLIQAAGAPTDAASLARAIGGRGGYVGPGSLNALIDNGPFAAHLYEGGPMGHFVVVDGLDQLGRIMIRDPWAGGSTYVMSPSEFLRVWNGEAVFK